MSRRISQDAASRVRGFTASGDLLWPGSSFDITKVAWHRGAGGLAIVPSRAQPRLLVPSGSRQAAARAIMRHGSDNSRLAKVQRHALALAVRSGAGRFLFRRGFSLDGVDGPTLIDRLSDLLGEPVVASVALTTSRANRKPVLHVLDQRGRTVAFVKVGVNTLTRQLVRREASALAWLNRRGLATVRVPEVIRAETWNELELLVLSPLPTWRGTSGNPTLLTLSMQEIAASSGEPADSSAEGYLRALVARARSAHATATDQDRSTVDRLRAVLDWVNDDVLRSLQLGAWHGDWSPWNCRMLDGRYLVWDWERYDPSAPLGFDALHYELQNAVSSGSARVVAARRCINRAADALASWSLTATQARTVAELYLVELGLRYLEDQQRQLGGAGGDIATWLVPALEDR